VTIIPGDVRTVPQPTPRPAGLAKRDWQEKIIAIAHEYACSVAEEIILVFIRKPTLSHAVFISEFIAKKQVQFAMLSRHVGLFKFLTERTRSRKMQFLQTN
jgi:hypothetical protein